MWKERERECACAFIYFYFVHVSSLRRPSLSIHFCGKRSSPAHRISVCLANSPRPFSTAIRYVSVVCVSDDFFLIKYKQSLQAIKLKPTSARAFHTIACLKSMMGQYKFALADFDRAVHLDPSCSLVCSVR